MSLTQRAPSCPARLGRKDLDDNTGIGDCCPFFDGAEGPPESRAIARAKTVAGLKSRLQVVRARLPPEGGTPNGGTPNGFSKHALSGGDRHAHLHSRHRGPRRQN
jgi:hypothetical protein